MVLVISHCYLNMSTYCDYKMLWDRLTCGTTWIVPGLFSFAATPSSFCQAWTDHRMWSCCMDYCEPDPSPDVIWLIQLYSHLLAFCIHFHLITMCVFLFQIRHPNVSSSQHKPPGETVLGRIMC